MFSTRHSVLVIRSFFFFFEIARHILNDTFVHTFTPTTTATMSTIQCDQIVFGYNYSVKCSRNIWQLSGLLQKTVPFCQLLKIWAIFNSNIWSHWSTWIIAANTFHTAMQVYLKRSKRLRTCTSSKARVYFYDLKFWPFLRHW